MENEQQIKEKIALSKDEKKLIESFILPICTAEIIAAVSQNYLNNILYLCLSFLGWVILVILLIRRRKIYAKIIKLINQLP
jgi:Flp pilus assembly protein TadB